MTDMEWTESINDGYVHHPEMATDHTLSLDTRDDGSIGVSCSHDDIKWPLKTGGGTWRESAEVSFVIPPERATEFKAALAKWLEES